MKYYSFPFNSKASKILVGSFLFMALSLSVLADDWQTGPGGKPSRHSLSYEIGPQAGDLLWQGSLSAVVAQQAVIDGDIVVMSRMFNINNVLFGTKIVAHDLMTGDTLWTKGLPVDFPSTDWRSRVSAFKDGVVYATRAGNTNYSYMYALNVTNGSIIWKSEGLVNESSTEGASFDSNGDLIVGNFDNIIRINHLDGTTVWQTIRSCPTTGGGEVAVFGDKGYYWEAAVEGPKISVIDLELGGYLYSSESLSPGIIQQVAPFVGPDGTVYGTRTMNNTTTDFLFALSDKGSYFEEKWSVPLGYVPFGTFGVGPDGTVYSYSQSDEVIRIDPINGNVIDTSEVVLGGDFSQPRMAIDAQGFIFVTNGGFTGGALHSFNPDLTLRWTENITNVNVGGPAIGNNGTLIVCGTGTNVRAYEGIGTDIKEIPQQNSLCVYPNPSNKIITIEYDFGNELNSGINIEILNSNGVQVYSKGYQPTTDVMFRETIQVKDWDPGVYFIRLKDSHQTIAIKRVVVL
jgi:outer membrane protein assembly factor BamB